MANIGLSKPYIAKYNATGSTVTYSAGKRFGKAVEMSLSVEGSNSNTLHADNGPAESASEFSGGTLSLTTDDLLPEDEAYIMGITESNVTGEGMPEGMKELMYGDNSEPPYLGVGIIRKKKKNGADKYQAIILPKVQFKPISEDAKTQGETIEWGTPTVEATVMRDDSENHSWVIKSSLVSTEADADAYIKMKLNITE